MKMGNKSTELSELLKDGYTEKYARFYLSGCAAEEKSPIYDPALTKWAHSHGFFVEHALLYGLNDSNCEDYLSDYDFYKVWPLNSWARLWINDKLTLRLMLSDPEFVKLMPKYYYYTAAEGLRALCDNPVQSGCSAVDFLAVLREVGEFACKPNNGTMAKGFYRVSYENGVYAINDEVCSADAIIKFVEEHPNYIFTEYLRPGGVFAKIAPKIHTLRINVLNEAGKPRITRCYLRFPDSGCGAANYFVFDGSNTTDYHVQVNVNSKTGEWGNAKLFFSNRTESIRFHPDSRVELSGVIPRFKQLKESVLAMARKFSLIEYMGFDVGITEFGFKLMEVNSHPGIGYLQAYESFYTDDGLRRYFQGKLKEIDALSPDQVLVRNKIR